MPHIVLTGFFKLSPTYVEEFKALSKDYVRESLAESGCEYHTFTQSQDDPTKFGFFEIFTSQEALDHHMNTTFQKEQAFFGKDPGVLVQPPTFEKFSLIEDIEKGIVV